MGIAEWFRSLRRREREEEAELIKNAETETPEEREFLLGDIESRQADMRAAGSVRQTPGSFDQFGR